VVGAELTRLGNPNKWWACPQNPDVHSAGPKVRLRVPSRLRIQQENGNKGSRMKLIFPPAALAFGLLGCGGIVNSADPSQDPSDACVSIEDASWENCQAVSERCRPIFMDMRPFKPQDFVCRLRCDENYECPTGFECRLWTTAAPESLDHVCFLIDEEILYCERGDRECLYPPDS